MTDHTPTDVDAEAEAAAPDGFTHADLTDGDLLELLARRGITGTEARTAIAQARSWPGRHRTLVETEVAAARAPYTDAPHNTDGDAA